VEHELLIGSGADVTLHDQIHVMAQMNIGAFEDEGYPDAITGTLLGVTDPILRRVRSDPNVLVDLGGQTYRFRTLNDDGVFELRRRMP